MMLQLAHISYKVPDRMLLQQITASIRPGAVTALMGSNGAGKSTLLKIISGELRATEGEVHWNGKSLRQWDTREIARTRAVLRQQYNMQMPFSVFDIISMGRYPHCKSRITQQCRKVIETVAEYTGVSHFLKRNYLTLSGGEQQRVQLARVLAQVWDTDASQKLILLDEPVSALDIQYQHQLLSLVKALTSQKFTIVAVLHDLNLAMQYADDVLLLKQGKTVTFTHKDAALTSGNIMETFGVQASLHQAGNIPHSFITINPMAAPAFNGALF
jgi:iron complex transport system ATP-binding protein